MYIIILYLCKSVNSCKAINTVLNKRIRIYMFLTERIFAERLAIWLPKPFVANPEFHKTYIYVFLNTILIA